MISIIICTYNRANYLANTIKALIFYLEMFKDLELIIVDNASTDRTATLCSKFIQEYPQLIIRYIYEPNLGLSYARNRGIKEARGEILIFLDDDAIPRKNWLKAILDVFNNTDAVVVGGKVDLIFEIDKPLWITSELENMLTKLNISNSIKKIDPSKHWLVGANLAFRKIIFEKVGFFNVQLGRRGKKLISNEETELLQRINKITDEIYYTPFAVVDHFVPKERLKLKWFLKRSFYGGYSSITYENNIKNVAINFFLMIKYFLMFLFLSNKKLYLIKLSYNLGFLIFFIKRRI